MQKAQVLSVDGVIAALRLLHREESQVAAFGRPGGGHENSVVTTRVMQAARMDPRRSWISC